jgi:hypothetical protein
VDDLRYPGQRFEPGRIYASVVADQSDSSTLCAGHRPRIVPHFLDDTDYAIDVFRRRVVLHDY